MSNLAPNKPILQEMRDLPRRQSYAYSTEKTYSDWVSRFIKFYALKSRSALMEDPEVKVEGFLTDLALNQNVAPSTQNFSFPCSCVGMHTLHTLHTLHTSPSTTTKKQGSFGSLALY